MAQTIHSKVIKIFDSVKIRFFISVAFVIVLVGLNFHNQSSLLNSLLFASPLLLIFTFFPSNRINNFVFFILLSLMYLGINYLSLYVIANDVFYWSGLLLVFIMNLFIFVIPAFLFSLFLTYVKKAIHE